MWYILTGINILGALIAILTLLNTAKNYVLAPKMGIYAFIRGAGMFALIFLQLYSLATPAGDWILKAGLFYWWGSVIYWAWAVRFSSIRKKGDSVIYSKT